MNARTLINSLNENIDIFATLFSNIAKEQINWKANPQKWSLLEIVNHLYDEEKDDFRMRTKMTLEDPNKKWSMFDPVKRVVEHKYNKRQFIPSIKKFLSERKLSISWLESLDDPNWDNTYNHPLIGEIKAGDLLAAWVAHDYYHMRQIVNLKIDYLNQVVKPYSTQYAT